MATSKDVFGFDELTKSFKKANAKYPDKVKSLLIASGNAVRSKLRARTPTGPGSKRYGPGGKLKKSWKSEKLIVDTKDGSIRISSAAPHSHLYVYGHRKVPRGPERSSNRGGNPKGYAKGNDILGKTVKEVENDLIKNAEKMYHDDILGDLKL